MSSGIDDGKSSDRDITSNTTYDPNIGVDSSDRIAVPQVVFTEPRIAAVGLTEESARDLKNNVCVPDYEMDTMKADNLHTQ